MKGTLNNRIARALRAAACAVVICGASSTAADARTIALRGSYVEEDPGVPTPLAPGSPALCTVDPSNATVENCRFEAGSATLTGTWIGKNVTHGTYKYNLNTDVLTGNYEEDFVGYSAGVGFGSVHSRGVLTATASDFRADARLVSGTGDFKGSRGRITYIGDTPANTSGHYRGRWILPGGARPNDRDSDADHESDRRPDRGSDRDRARTIRVDAHYTEPAGETTVGSDGKMHYRGQSHFTGTFSGTASYDLVTGVDAAGNLTYEGPERFTGTVAGCGRGSFTLDIKDGKVYTTRFDPATQSAPGYNAWSVRRGSGTGALAGLISGSGRNDWTNYPLDEERFGVGHFTGKVRCHAPETD